MAKQKHEDHQNHEAWIIPYADMVTLLFAFFVVMYAMSLTDKNKMKVVSESVSDAFIGDRKGGDKSKQLDVMGMEGRPTTSRRFVMKRSITNQQIIEEMRQNLETEGFDVIFQDKASPIKFIIDERGVTISISAGYLFEPNSVEIPEYLYPVIQIIAQVLNDTDRMVSIEGHTDGQVTVGSKFYDNWDLSALRATSMLRTLVQEFNVNPRRLTASGLGPYRPIASNETEAGRAQNRRVDIIMLNASAPEELLENEFVPGSPPKP